METLPRILQSQIYKFVGFETELIATLNFLFAKTEEFATPWSSGCRYKEIERRLDLPADHPDYIPYDQMRHGWESAWDFKDARKMMGGYLQDYDCVITSKAICLAHLKKTKGTATDRDKIMLLLGGIRKLMEHWRNETCPFTSKDNLMFSDLRDIDHLYADYEKYGNIVVEDTLLASNPDIMERVWLQRERAAWLQANYANDETAW